MRHTILALAAVAAALAAVAVLVVLGLSQGEPPAPVEPPPGKPVRLVTSVEPSHGLSGDRVVADLEVTVDTARVDPATLDVGAFFRPFRPVGGATVERSDLGQTTVIHYRYPLQCLDRACAIGASRRAIGLPIGIVRYTPRQGDIVSLPLTWPAVTVESRLSDEQRADVRLRPLALEAAEGDQVPALAPAGRALAAGWALVGGAALLLLAAAALVLLALRRGRRPLRRAEEATADPPLASALAAVSQAEGEAEQRVALDALALRLDDAGETGLAREARRLAWSAAGPSDDQQLAALVRAVAARQEAAA